MGLLGDELDVATNSMNIRYVYDPRISVFAGLPGASRGGNSAHLCFLFFVLD